MLIQRFLTMADNLSGLRICNRFPVPIILSIDYPVYVHPLVFPSPKIVARAKFRDGLAIFDEPNSHEFLYRHHVPTPTFTLLGLDAHLKNLISHRYLVAVPRIERGTRGL
jgi:hypothetical protein